MSSPLNQTPSSDEAPGDCWQSVSANQWTCIVCRDSVLHYRRHLVRHLNSRRHKQTVAHNTLPLSLHDERERASISTIRLSDVIDASINAPPIANDIPMEDEGLGSFSVQGWSTVGSPDVDELVDESGYDPDEEDIEPSWDLMYNDPTQDATHEDSMHEDSSYLMRAPVDHSDKWYPWHSRAATTLDIVANIPRSSFSTQQINTMFWFLKANGVSRVPYVGTLRSQNAALHNMCGIRTLEYDREMANPHVRPYLHFYPEDAGKTVNEYWHATHWHEVADSSLVTPMAVINNTHFFVYEPAVLTNGCVVMPYRWFLHGRSIAARAWPLRAVKRGNDTGWIVEEFKTVIVPQGEFLISFGSWGVGQLHRSLPSAKCIFSMFLLVTCYVPSGRINPTWIWDRFAEYTRRKSSVSRRQQLGRYARRGRRRQGKGRSG
ncbi:hypothetical protein EDB89DRAFT_1915359 [Lactarius sanguifluus]|nr:hypothetical protein EDB89DRAFT_1915359 [Lactarius sanguifluus]